MSAPNHNIANPPATKPAKRRHKPQLYHLLSLWHNYKRHTHQQIASKEAIIAKAKKEIVETEEFNEALRHLPTIDHPGTVYYEPIMQGSIDFFEDKLQTFKRGLKYAEKELGVLKSRT